VLNKVSVARLLCGAAMGGLLMGGGAAAAQDATGGSAPILLPGAPGQAARVLNAQEAVRIANTRYSPDDAAFMRDMIPHHAQAAEMAALVKGRSSRKEIVDVAGRIEASQADEISFMRSWLSERGEAVATAGHGGHGGHGGHTAMTAAQMADMGMAPADQLAALRDAKGPAFDRLFLQLMIRHHEGAVRMVEALHKKAGSAYDPVLFDFSSDISNEQTAEIRRMNTLLAGLSEDPRAGLRAGFRDRAGAKNMRLVASLPKPAGFFDPPTRDMPRQAEARPTRPPRPAQPRPRADAAGDAMDEQSTKAPSGASARRSSASPTPTWPSRATPWRSATTTASTCTGWAGRRADAAELGRVPGRPGRRVHRRRPADHVRRADPRPRRLRPAGRGGEGEPGALPGPAHLRHQGPAPPVRWARCRPAAARTPIRWSPALAPTVGSSSMSPAPRRCATRRSSPAASARPPATPEPRCSASTWSRSRRRPLQGADRRQPRVFADPPPASSPAMEGRRPRREDAGNEPHRPVPRHHRLPAGQDRGRRLLGQRHHLDISDPRRPKRIDAVTDPGFAYWHSATFNNDGTKVLFTDEWGGGSRPRCRTYDRADWGANAIYDIVGGRLTRRSYYKLPAPQTETENCVAHNGSVVPVPGRDVFVQAWYQGGVSVIDFTDSARPVEIAYFDRGPVHKDALVLGGYWSTYWYGGKIYGTEIARGLDVLTLEPSEQLSANEIAAAALADQGRASIRSSSSP
jgi:uncharacterized protein (DUF305 family)